MTRPPRPSTLPVGIAPPGFNREQSAEYTGFLLRNSVGWSRMGACPQPKQIDGRAVWDRLQLDLMFAALPDADGRGDIWSKAAV